MTQCHRSHRGNAFAIATALALAACSSPQPFRADVTATDIVRTNSADAFASFFDRVRDGVAFTSFQAEITAAHDRTALTSAWRSVPTLAAQDRDFLDKQVFTKAIDEHRWPRTASPASLEAAFADGVRLGVQEFLRPPR